MLASDNTCELFYRTAMVQQVDGKMRMRYLDVPQYDEWVDLTTPRLWRGTLETASWTLDRDGHSWRPNSRLYHVDVAALKKRQQAGAARQLPPPPPRPHSSKGAGQELAGAWGPSAPAAAACTASGHGVGGVVGAADGDGGGAVTKALVGAAAAEASVQLLAQGPVCRSNGASSSGREAAAAGGTGGSARTGGGGAALGAIVDGPAHQPRAPPGAAAAQASAPPSPRRLAAQIEGGADEASFMAAYNAYWEQQPQWNGQVVQCNIAKDKPVNPWRLWQEVHAWGGQNQVQQHQAYERAILPLDCAISRGLMALDRPSRNRQPADKWAWRMKNGIDSRACSSAGATSGGSSARAAVGGGGDGSRVNGSKRRRGSSAGGEASEGQAGPCRSGGPPEGGSTGGADGGGGGSGSSSDMGGGHSRGQAANATAGGAAGGKLVAVAKASAAVPQRSAAGQHAVAALLGRNGGGAAGGTLGVLHAKLTPQAARLQPGSEVEYRTLLYNGRCASGWHAGVVLRLAPGSHWEGGRRLLLAPAAAPAPAPQAAAHLQDGRGDQQPTGDPLGGQQQQRAAHAASAPAEAGEAAALPPGRPPLWLPLLWRGPAHQPFATPVVLVRPLRQRAPAAAPRALSSVKRGELVEAERGGCWCLAEVLDVCGGAGGGADRGGGDSGAARVGRPQSLLLRNAAPPEADGVVWRCCVDRVRPHHPGSGEGVLLPAERASLVPLATLQRDVAPVTSPNATIQAFACLEHLRAVLRTSAA